jgi:hypothetical protein
MQGCGLAHWLLGAHVSALPGAILNSCSIRLQQRPGP